MLKKTLNYIRITPSSMVVIIVLLLLLDLFIRSYWAGLYQTPGSIRLVNTEVESLIRLERELKEAEGYKIVFLGDSQAYGSSVKNSSETVPAYLEQDLRRQMPDKNIKVFNFSFKGMGISENYFIINALLDKDVDLFVYNLSTSWFNRNETFDHPNVIRLTDNLPEEEKLNRMGIKDERTFKDRLSDKLNLTVSRYWGLYENRAVITTMLLGKSVREKITESQIKLTNPKKALKDEKAKQRLYQPWNTKDWKAILGKVNYKFGQVNLNPYNRQMIFYTMLLQDIQRNKIPAMFYNSPQNIDMLETVYGMDKKEWLKNSAQIKKMTNKGYITHLDYTYLVPGRYFTDAIHMDKNGNKIVAQQLAKDILDNWR